MIEIHSEDGYPNSNQILARLDYFIGAPGQGGILILGRDSRDVEYRSKKEAAGSYKLPSGSSYGVSVGKYPAIHFPFTLKCKQSVGDLIAKTGDDWDELFKEFDLKLMDSDMKRIELDAHMEKFFKEIAVWGPYELTGILASHFWGEMYRNRTPALEKFLDKYRG